MIPAVDNAHVAEGGALLTSRYVNQTNVKGIVKALMLKFQEKENDLWSLINGMQLANHPMMGGPWSILDQLAALVGVPGGRLARSDADLLQAIKIQIAINRSDGHPDDLINICLLVVAAVGYTEWPPAAWEVGVTDVSSSTATALVQYLGKASPAGVAGNVRYTLSAGPFVQWKSVYGGGPGAGFASYYGGAPLNQLAALAAVSAT